MKTAILDKEQVWEILSHIPDPEIPVISITELGVVRDVDVQGDKVIVSITPTYSGCPAMNTFEADIKKILLMNGFEEVEIKTVYSPAWTTAWISEEARERLREYGIAPPVRGTAMKASVSYEMPQVECPKCGSKNTELKSEFGSTACKSLHACKDCLEPFEYFKCI